MDDEGSIECQIYECSELGCNGSIYYIRAKHPCLDGKFYDTWLLPSTNLIHIHEKDKVRVF